MTTCIGEIKMPPRWTLERFLERSIQLHGDKFDYSQIREDHIKGRNSRIPIRCKKCDYCWSPTLDCHVQGKGCPDCAGVAPYTLERFLKKARQIHGDKFDYSEVTGEAIRGNKCKVPLRCKECNYRWSPRINNLIQGQGCPSCAGKAPWSLERFLERAYQTHGDKFDYSGISKDDIKGHESRISLKCKTCNHQWSPTIDSHIQGTGCPSCSEKVPWTLKRFIERSRQIHEDKFDYSEVTPDSIKGKDSKILVRCKKCNHHWFSTVSSHIKGVSCPGCTGQIPWTLEKFLERSFEVHGDVFDYKKVTPDHINGAKSKIPIICKKCNHEWSPAIANFIGGQGCPVCKSSHGERECRKILEECGVEYLQQISLPELPRNLYDFCFIHEDHLYFLEFDGEQHFRRVPYFHREEGDFEMYQERDILKTKVVLKRNATLIRIDHTQIISIYDHLSRAIESGSNLYFSSPEKYRYITDRL